MNLIYIQGVTIINSRKSTVFSLLDTGSPISFICSKVFYKFFDSDIALRSSEKSYKAVNGEYWNFRNNFKSIVLEPLPLVNAEILLHIIKDDINGCQLILGRDFFVNNKISSF